MSSFDASGAGTVFQSLAVVLAIVALSPAPLALPSGIAVAVIGLMGAVSLLTSPVPAPPEEETPVP
jgi:spore maturation protein SpmB